MSNSFNGGYYSGPSGASVGAVNIAAALSDGLMNLRARQDYEAQQAQAQQEKDRARMEDYNTREAVYKALNPGYQTQSANGMSNRDMTRKMQMPDAGTQVQLFNVKQQMEEKQKAAERQQREQNVLAYAMRGGLDTLDGQKAYMTQFGYDPIQYAPKQFIESKFPKQNQLSGDAENLAVILGRTPTMQELNNYRQSGRSVTNVNNVGGNAFDKAMGDQWAKVYDGLFTAARTAEEGMSTIEAGRAILNSDDFRTGKLEPAKMWISQVASGLGIDPAKLGLDQAAGGEAFQSIVMKNLLTELAKQKGPQTEGDANRALKANIQLGNTPAGNAFILDYAESLNRRTIEKAQWVYKVGREKYNGDVYKAEQDWNKYIQNRPLIATSPNSGLPVTYHKYVDGVMKSGKSQDEADVMWIQFVNAGNKRGK
jgi:hypothetical protein